MAKLLISALLLAVAFGIDCHDDEYEFNGECKKIIHGVVSSAGVWEYRFSRDDHFGHTYQWRHYYSTETGEPIDARVPVGWFWNRFEMGGEHHDCPATDDAGNMLNICAGQNVNGEDRCCIRGAKAASQYCLEWGWCLTINFIEENPRPMVHQSEEYLPECADDSCSHWEQPDKLFSYVILGDQNAEVLDGKGNDFYTAIEEPVYVLMAVGDGPHTSGEFGDSSFTKDNTNWAKFFNTATPPNKCSDGALRDCNGQCFNDCKVYGLPGSEVAGYEGCLTLKGDYVCDRGQRIMGNGQQGPNFDCELWNWDSNDSGSSDCQCEWDDDGNSTGRWMTCSGYCLTDADCASDYWGKETCTDWLRDDICDYGQRISEAGITMHFECERWGYDNWACNQMDEECAEDFSEDDEGSCPDTESDANGNGQRDVNESTGTGHEGNKIPAFQVPGETPAPTDAPHYVPLSGGAGNVAASSITDEDISVLKAQVEALKDEVLANQEKAKGGVDGSPDNRRAPSFEQGDSVWANYYHAGYTYPGTILKIDSKNGQTDIMVSYEDGDVQNDVNKDEIFALEKMEVGDAVWKFRDDYSGWDYGWVAEANVQSNGAWKYTFEDSSGAKQEVWADFDKIRPDFPFLSGDRVWAQKEGNLKWVKGTIQDVSDHGNSYRYDIAFDSGDVWKNAPAAYIYFIHGQRVKLYNGGGFEDAEAVCEAARFC